MSCRPLDCGIVAAPFPLISFIISDGVACLTCRCPPRFAVSLPSSHHRLVPSSRSPFRPAMLLAWLGGSVPSVISLVISGNLLACRSAFRPASRFSLRRSSRFSFRFSSRPSTRSLGRMSSPPCPIAPRVVRLAVINRPAMLVEGRGAGRDGIAYLAITCPPCRRCLPRMASRLRAFPRLRSALLARVPPFMSVL